MIGPNLISNFSNSFFVYFDDLSKSENTIILFFKGWSGSSGFSGSSIFSGSSGFSSSCGLINFRNSTNSGIAFTNCVAVFSPIPSSILSLLIFSSMLVCDVKMLGSAFKICCIVLSATPRPNILDAAANFAILASSSCFCIDVLIFVAIFFWNPSTCISSSNDKFIILWIESAPLVIIFSIFFSPNPSISRSLKNFVIDFTETRGSVFTFFSIISTFVEFHS